MKNGRNLFIMYNLNDEGCNEETIGLENEIIRLLSCAYPAFRFLTCNRLYADNPMGSNTLFRDETNPLVSVPVTRDSYRKHIPRNVTHRLFINSQSLAVWKFLFCSIQFPGNHSLLMMICNTCIRMME